VFLLNSIALDTEKEEAGDWVAFPVNGRESGLRLRIARFGNPSAKKMAADLSARAKRLPDGSIPRELVDINFEKVFAATILTGWEPAVDLDGEPLEYSPANAERILRDPRFAHLRDFVASYATTTANYLTAAVEADEDALKNGSAGGSSAGRSSPNRRSKTG
jgi:hypothetical protein